MERGEPVVRRENKRKMNIRRQKRGDFPETRIANMVLEEGSHGEGSTHLGKD